MIEKCPGENCFHYILPGGAADMSGAVYQNLQDSFKNGKWKSFPDGGCSCREKCKRIHSDSNVDYYDPNE